MLLMLGFFVPFNRNLSDEIHDDEGHTPDVGSGVVLLLAFDDFWRNEGARSDTSPLLCFPDTICVTEVDQLNFSISGQEQVVGFDVAVYDTSLFEVHKYFDKLYDNVLHTAGIVGAHRDEVSKVFEELVGDVLEHAVVL